MEKYRCILTHDEVCWIEQKALHHIVFARDLMLSEMQSYNETGDHKFLRQYCQNYNSCHQALSILKKIRSKRRALVESGKMFQGVEFFQEHNYET